MTITTEPVTLAADPTAVRQWLAILHGDSPGRTHICSTLSWSGRTFGTGDRDGAIDYVSQLDRQGAEGIYARVTTLAHELAPGKRGSAADSMALPALWADLDIAGPGHKHELCAADCAVAHSHVTMPLPPDEVAGRAVVTQSGLPEPTLWIHSGGGLYPIWMLAKPHLVDEQTIAAAKALTAGWQRVIEQAAARLGWWYGRGVGDLARVLRIPGTINRKDGLARPCRIVAATGTRYTMEQLVRVLDAAEAWTASHLPAAERAVVSAAPAVVGALQPVTPRQESGITPGDDFGQRASWAEILEPAGWREHYQEDAITYWTRPGKHTGTSASTNATGTDHLHVFTTAPEALPLEGGESYSKLGCYAVLHHQGDHAAAVRELASLGYGTPLPSPAEWYREAFEEIIGAPLPEVEAPETPAEERRVWTAEIDVSNAAVAADWLRYEAGRGKLAGVFLRSGAVVHTPREGEEGYVPLSDGQGDEDGPAQIRPVTDSSLASRISYSYGVFRFVRKGEDWEAQQALFPRSAARTALDVPDMLPHLRPLRGVIHSPVFRPDGSLIEAPGYDQATGLLHLPEPGLVVPPVPERPSAEQVKAAVGLLMEMIAGFPFVSDHYKANYLGCLITPVLRAVCPPPYKLHAVEAHQPGSGKTLLANLSRWIHGGVFRSEVPEDDTELRKQITSILTITTGPIVLLDNLSGSLKSSALAGLLTSAQWDDRPLGSTAWTKASNDRLWTITGNNISIGGDLPRRTIRTVIDPGVPNPETRTGFAISNLEEWVREKRGELLAAILTVVRSWVVAGMPLAPERTSDGYARWERVIGAILANAGIAGEFDDRSTQIEVGGEDDEWGDFLMAAYRSFSSQPWTAKELLSKAGANPAVIPGAMPLDALPGDLEARALRANGSTQGLAKSLGRWLQNREGRWTSGYTVRSVGKDAKSVKLWQIETM